MDNDPAQILFIYLDKDKYNPIAIVCRYSQITSLIIAIQERINVYTHQHFTVKDIHVYNGKSPNMFVLNELL